MPRVNYTSLVRRYRGAPFDPSKLEFFKQFGNEYHLALTTYSARHFCASVARMYLRRFGFSPTHMPDYGSRVAAPRNSEDRLAFTQALRRRIQEWFRGQDPTFFSQ
ncbi:hypothetical protein B0H16DRAFT_1743568 [Mycena metata]|uniref:Uncharacterized protein n=1 Tax=Mycena metata TaxID=1033252 RepID=A0AAD7ME92_9AGAR|nr:hypothetical protein B0H16DRAFT_1743568 [Mycena metata]